MKVEQLIKDEKPYWKVTSSKMKYPLFVQKTNDGFVNYEVTTKSGPVPKSCQGVYTRPNYALEAIERYLFSKKQTVAKRRDDMYERNHSAKSSAGSN